jgi:hypothetical protein
MPPCCVHKLLQGILQSLPFLAVFALSCRQAIKLVAVRLHRDPRSLPNGPCCKPTKQSHANHVPSGH